MSGFTAKYCLAIWANSCQKTAVELNIEYCRLNIEYLWFASGGSIIRKPIDKDDGAQRHPQIFNIHYPIFNNRALG